MSAIHPERIELTLPSRPGLEQVAVDTSASLATLMGFPDDRVQDLQTAVEEACLNAIEHGNKKHPSAKVLVALTADESKLQIEIHDHSKVAFQPDIATPDITAKISGEDQRTRGWGLFLIKQLMDDVEFSWNAETGNVLCMVLDLNQ
jgi:serine/threonine-protein kinase RsbW